MMAEKFTGPNEKFTGFTAPKKVSHTMIKPKKPKYSGVSGSLIKKQAEERKTLREKHARERQKSKSYGKKGKVAAYNRKRMAERQAREMAELMANQQAEQETIRAKWRIKQAGVQNQQDLQNQYALGNISRKDFSAENFRRALLENHGLGGKDAEMYEKAVKNMTHEDLRNLGKMYENVLEVWQDSEGYFEAISEEVVKKIVGMGRQTKAAISRMLRKGDSDLDEGTLKLAVDAWNFRLKSKKDTIEAISNMGYDVL